ncbi:MAG: DEAD/DEAH box helicase [Candidatus Diapherotrites archaeon]|nr:DEAD/DEAH box helicase [Candidatus Diapherotrites archaeon]
MEKIEEVVLEANGFQEFNEMQLKVLKKDWKAKNIVVSAPTASGKTIAAELLALNSIIAKKRKAVYTCPLRALASEHFKDWKKKYSDKCKIRMALSTGDFDSSSNYLQNYDLIFTTFEKLQSLVRHKAEWLSGIGLLIIDEIHELDSNRGPTIEVTTAELMQLNPKVQILALSATIPNSKEISKWLNAELVESDFRPVHLKEGVHFNEQLHFGREIEEVPGDDSVKAIIEQTLHEKEKQALVFCATRKSAEATAKKLAKTVEKRLSEKEKESLLKKSQELLHTLEQPTEQCRTLSELARQGIAFHHAGLMAKQRELIEELFKSNHLKVLTATPTLAAGVNLPAFRVIISSVYRYSEAEGSAKIPVREYKQMAGRAGRPKYDKFGESIIIARTESEADFLKDYYITGQMEAITSQLGIEPILRTHTLAVIASGFVFDLASLEDFFKKTFYALQYGNLEALFLKIQGILEELQNLGFVQLNEKEIKATKLGKRVSELYLDPLSAFKIITALGKKEISNPGLLFLLCDNFEFAPYPTVPKGMHELLWEEMLERKQEFPVNVDIAMFEDSDLLKKFSAVKLLELWLQEKPEILLMKEFNVQPGILHAKLERLDWLAYAAFELAQLLELKRHLLPLGKLRKRLKYGIKEELIALVELKGIGRVRARKLYNAGLTTISSVKKADLRDLEILLGAGVAKNLKEHFGEKIGKEKPSAEELEQSTIDEF